MKYLLLLLAVLPIASFTYIHSNQTEKNCVYFHTGSFGTGDKSVPEGYYILERNDSIQKEIIHGTNKWTTYKIKWTSDCEYTLDFIDCYPKSMVYMLPKKVKTKILETRGDSCFYHASGNGASVKLWMVKLDKVQ